MLLVTGYANETTGEYGMDRLQVTDPAWLPATKLAEILRTPAAPAHGRCVSWIAPTTRWRPTRSTHNG